MEQLFDSLRFLNVRKSLLRRALGLASDVYSFHGRKANDADCLAAREWDGAIDPSSSPDPASSQDEENEPEEAWLPPIGEDPTTGGLPPSAAPSPNERKSKLSALKPSGLASSSNPARRSS